MTMGTPDLRRPGRKGDLNSKYVSNSELTSFCHSLPLPLSVET